VFIAIATKALYLLTSFQYPYRLPECYYVATYVLVKKGKVVPVHAMKA
jgi:hypothetical protein